MLKSNIHHNNFAMGNVSQKCQDKASLKRDYEKKIVKQNCNKFVHTRHILF